MTREQSNEVNKRMAELNRQFKRRLAQIEHEHVMRLMATFQEFKARSFAIRNGRPMEPAQKGTDTIELGAAHS